MRARLETSPSTVARAPTRMSRSRNRCCGEIDTKSVLRRRSAAYSRHWWPEPRRGWREEERICRCATTQRQAPRRRLQCRRHPAARGDEDARSFRRGTLYLEDHAVPRRLDLRAQPLSEVGSQLPWVGAPYRHSEMSEDREPRLGVADNAPGVGEAEVRQASATVHQHEMDDHHLSPVLLGNAFVVLGVRHPAELVAETEPERLRLVHVARSGGEGKAVDPVGRLRLQPHNLFRKAP